MKHINTKSSRCLPFFTPPPLLSSQICINPICHIVSTHIRNGDKIANAYIMHQRSHADIRKAVHSANELAITANNQCAAKRNNNRSRVGPRCVDKRRGVDAHSFSRRHNTVPRKKERPRLGRAKNLLVSA